MVTDNIADMLTRIRNANMVKHQIVEIPATKMSKAIAATLKEEGFIENFEIYNENIAQYLLLSLKYKGQSPTRVQTFLGQCGIIDLHSAFTHPIGCGVWP